jgi:hypothetical protein
MGARPITHGSCNPCFKGPLAQASKKDFSGHNINQKSWSMVLH